jgi:hypothetical protein
MRRDDKSDHLLGDVASGQNDEPAKFPCIIRDFSDGLKLSSVPVKGLLTLVSNWYILKELNQFLGIDDDLEVLIWALAGAAATASMTNRFRNAWLWNKNLFPKVQGNQPEQKSHYAKIICIKGNLGLQAINNWSLNVLAGAVQIWHAFMHIYRNSLPGDVACLPWYWVFCLVPAFLIAVQYKANRLDKQKMQLDGLIKNTKSLCSERKYGKLFFATLITLGTIVAFAMQSFFVLKSIVTDFLNFVLNNIDSDLLITDPNVLYGINLVSTIISISAGAFQSLCTAAIIFRLFQWNEKIKPQLSSFWQRNKCFVIFGLANNMTYSLVNMLMTMICVQDSFNKVKNTNSSFYNDSLIGYEAISALNCSQKAVPVKGTHTETHSEHAWLIMALAVLVGLAQAIPMFFNNVLYNFFVDVPRAEREECIWLNTIQHAEFAPENYHIKRRGTKVCIVGDKQFNFARLKSNKPDSSAVCYSRSQIHEHLRLIERGPNSISTGI